VLHNYARDRQHERDDLLLPEVDAELAAMATEPVDDATHIRSVQQTAQWSNFRQQFADDMFAEYLVARGEQENEYRDRVDSYQMVPSFVLLRHTMYLACYATYMMYLTCYFLPYLLCVPYLLFVPCYFVPSDNFYLTCRSMAEANKKKTRCYLTWTPEMDAALLAVLVEHRNIGDRAQNGWKPHVYTACIKHVKETCGIDITKDNIVGRIKTFDKHYEIISKMLAQSGFGWDWETNKVTVDSDEVWTR
jgi:hypothetical protein